VIGNAELQFPFPGSGTDRSAALVHLPDTGQVYQEGQRMRASELRYSAGIGLSLDFPGGPAQVELC
jgi:outer membrane protein insertion porin family